MLNSNSNLDNILAKSRPLGRKLEIIGLTSLLSLLVSGFTLNPTFSDEKLKKYEEKKIKLETPSKLEVSILKPTDLRENEYVFRVPKFVLKAYKILMVPNSQFWPKSIYIRSSGLKKFRDEFYKLLSINNNFELAEIDNYFNILSKNGNIVLSYNSNERDQYHELVHKTIREELSVYDIIDLIEYRTEFLKKNTWIFDCIHPGIFNHIVKGNYTELYAHLATNKKYPIKSSRYPNGLIEDKVYNEIRESHKEIDNLLNKIMDIASEKYSYDKIELK